MDEIDPEKSGQETSGQEPAAPPVPPAPPAEAAVPPRINAIAALANVILAPKAAFRSLAQSRWSWAFPLALLLGVTFVSQMGFWYRVNMGEFMREQAKYNSLVAKQMEANPDAIDKMDEMPKLPMALFRSLSYEVVMVIWFFVAALTYWLCFLALGDDLKYRGAMTAVAWCSVPVILKSALSIVFVFVKDPTYMDPNNLVLSNPGAILGLEALPGWLYALLSLVDFFVIWKLVLYVIAFKQIAKTTATRAVSVILAVFVLVALISVGAAAIFMTK